MQQVSAIEKVFHSPSPDRAILKELLDSLVKIHTDLIQNHKIYSVLDEAADKVLLPFLQEEKRPFGDEIAAENIHKTIKRYSAYFSGMLELCEQFSHIVQESHDSLNEDPPLTTTF